MWTLWLLFSATIVLSAGRAVDYEDLGKYIDSPDSKLSYGLKYSEQLSYEDDVPAATSEEAGIYYDTGVFTKYPESPKEWDYQPPQVGELPFEGLRERRQAIEKNGDASIDVNKQFAGNVLNLNRAERRADGKDTTISLKGFIDAIEHHLITSAQEINAVETKGGVKKRSLSDAKPTQNKKQTTGGDDSIDVNKDLFQSLFEFTRPQREIENLKSATIPLDGLIRAVESTLINSARHLNGASTGAKRKRSTDAEHIDEIDAVNAESGTTEAAPRPQRQIEKVRIPLSGLIQAIENSLISSADSINAASLNSKRKRSVQSGDNPVDVSKHFTDRIQALARSQRGTDSDQEVTIPLDSLIRTIESQLLNTAQAISKSERADRTKRSPDDDWDSSEEKDEKEGKKWHKKYYNLQKIAPSHGQPSLDLLNPITFRSVSNDQLKTTERPSSSEESSAEDGATSTILPFHETNLTVIDSTETTHVIPDENNKIVHVQHQNIRQTVFRSNLAILPTIPPQKINAPLPTTVPLDVETTRQRKVRSNDNTTESTTEVQVDEQEQKQSEETEKLREQIAEVQANPVILSTV